MSDDFDEPLEDFEDYAPVKLLLDTHMFLWFINGDANLSAVARQLIEDHENERLLSIASLWELAIKISIGKLELNISFADLLEQQITGNAIDLLPISPAHLDVLKTLSFIIATPLTASSSPKVLLKTSQF